MKKTFLTVVVLLLAWSNVDLKSSGDNHECFRRLETYRNC